MLASTAGCSRPPSAPAAPPGMWRGGRLLCPPNIGLVFRVVKLTSLVRSHPNQVAVVWIFKFLLSEKIAIEMEPSSWCHFNSGPPTGQRRGPLPASPSLSSSPFPPPSRRGGGFWPTGNSVTKSGRRDRELVAGASEAPAGEEALVALGCPVLPLAAVSQWSARGLRVSWDVSSLPSFVFEWAGWVAEGRQKVGEARVRIWIEMWLPFLNGFNNTY